MTWCIGQYKWEKMGHFYPWWLNGAAGPLCRTEPGSVLRSPLTAPAILNEFCSDYTHGYFRGQFKAKISVLTQIQRTQCALRRISSHPCRLPSCRNSNRALVTNGCFFFVILSLKVTVIGENVTRTSLLYDKRLLNAVFITSETKTILTDLLLMSEDRPSK